MPDEIHPAYPAWRAALSDTAPVGFGLVPLGLAFGVLMVQSGFAWWWTPVFSVLVYAGSLEFLMIGLVLAATPLATIAVTTFLVNFRHVFYALSFPLHVVRGPLRRTYAMYALTDETYAVVATRAPGALSGARVLWIQVLCQAYWVGGGILGALVGSLLPDVPGLDFALTALFAVLAIDAFRATRDVPAPLLAVGCAIVAQLVAPGQMLVVAMTGFVALLVGRYLLTEGRRDGGSAGGGGARPSGSGPALGDPATEGRDA
ncbi:AzlC family ABC transporter permease [Sanguibacter sp. HDW7]|uniref:AzlC family ABC transporter permease n=1 Tax=Sanguibacter sp. HDW7 TaxID=2714931 RepID=UPI00140827E0|nr:AzlC family ABC transporter permease [Sanguibacter sp. HDW7]QIK84644.1 AzlC family ABC transporter permease [Sanguibacter sp. HDW7]